MLRFVITMQISQAADVAATSYYVPVPPDATRRWYLVSATLTPSASAAADATDHSTIALKGGSGGSSTAMFTALDTASAALVAGTPVNPDLTATRLQREVLQGYPLYFSIDTSPGAGKAIQLAVTLEFEEQRV